MGLRRSIGGFMRRTLIKRCLAWRRLPWLMALLAMLLCAPAMELGLQIDDHFHRASLTRPDLEFLVRSPAGLFDFIRGEETVRQWIRARRQCFPDAIEV